MPIDTDAQAVLDQYAKFNAPPIETLTPENARNNPTLKNAVEEMAAGLKKVFDEREDRAARSAS